MEQLPLRYRRRFIFSTATTAPIRPQLDPEAKIGMLSEGLSFINLGGRLAPSAWSYRIAFSDACYYHF